MEAVQENNVELVTEILGDISGLSVRDDSVAELSKILQEPHFQVQYLYLISFYIVPSRLVSSKLIPSFLISGPILTI